MNCTGLSLLSGGLDSQLAIRVLERAGATVEAIAFETPFFGSERAVAAAKALGVKLHVIDFLADEIELLENPPHGFGGAMNPCIDCHARMIRRAGELMARLGYDFVATGEVRGQRPMSQNAQSLLAVEKASGLKGRLVRPLSAKLLEPTTPEQEGKLDRAKLLDISGRAHLSFDADTPSQRIGAFDTELVKEFWLGFVRKANVTLHIRKLAGENSHHIVEGMFKSAARTLRAACAVDPSLNGEIPSTKGVL